MNTEPLRIESIPPSTEIVLWPKPEGGVYSIARYEDGRPYSADHVQREDEANRIFDLRVAEVREANS